MGENLHVVERHPLEFTLTAEGKLMVKNLETNVVTEQPWFKNPKSGKGWLVKKRRSFKGLIAMAAKDGDYDDLK